MSKILLASSCAVLILAKSAAANIIYTIDLPAAGDVTVRGTITTDGVVGILSVADLVDFDLFVSSASLSVTTELLGPGHGALANTSLVRFEGVNASGTTLFLQPLSQPPGLIDIESYQACAATQVIVTPVPPGGYAEQLRTCNGATSDGPEIGLPMSGVQLAIAPSATPPVITSLIATPSVLWPPNQEMITVNLSVTATGTPAPTCHVPSVTSNEGSVIPGEIESEVIGPLAVNLRAERLGVGDGRVYAINLACSNVAGDVMQAVIVTVPHDQRP
jgi:hypothetical protein